MLFARQKPDHVARMDLLNGTALTLHPTGPGRDDNDLTQGMSVPGVRAPGSDARLHSFYRRDAEDGTDPLRRCAGTERLGKARPAKVRPRFLSHHLMGPEPLPIASSSIGYPKRISDMDSSLFCSEFTSFGSGCSRDRAAPVGFLRKSGALFLL